ncbi:copper resistance protein NlpE N-terminal domain-containing protein [Empedobacter falsenii]|uniref:copper resistance protein NlpE n=1 Tax=Empedobacter stercoris TaxID=1628248 RepID=UPI00166283A2|nr:copper resistance protein NlpE [Empedobacter stercoris]MCA4777549.1 copper resistance protein NlpE N-terminal domain-containing protein [Empedobacter stercoris]MCA4809664.1 copper resistance protein NlpE N-terminal domain-containing protein [Empedobacter stercoris]QNT14695.1 copper resistance protein NlpE [Empedobacter stercoris]
MKKSIILTLFTVSIMMSCETKKEESINNTKEVISDSSASIIQNDTIADIHNSKTSIDWVGTYEGVLPCADCPGIKTTVTLNKDETIKIVSDYMKGNTTFEEQGQFEWTADNNAIFLDTKDKNRYFYKVGENKLIVLSQEGEELDGPLANNYILTKK